MKRKLSTIRKHEESAPTTSPPTCPSQSGHASEPHRGGALLGLSATTILEVNKGLDTTKYSKRTKQFCHDIGFPKVQGGSLDDGDDLSTVLQASPGIDRVDA